MRWLYSTALYLIVPVVIFRLWWRGRKNPDYRQRLAERFAFFPPLEDKPRIWLHAVSVGETIAAVPLIKKLLHDYPSYNLLVTTTTPTGSVQLSRLFPDRVEHVYFPYDLPGVVRRFLSRVRPELLVIMETELWPNLIHHCAQRDIPVLIVNARLSPKSLAGYKKILPLIRPVFPGIRRVAPQSESDADRFQLLGAQKSQIVICGNLKFDLEIPIEVSEAGAAFKNTLGNRPVWIAASTHEGEDEQILNAHQNVLDAMKDALLILVPRHPERFDAVAKLCLDQGMSLARRSNNERPSPSTQVYLGDTMGELLQLYVAADIAFVGGSLVPTGGHNPLEPAALGLPVLSGPHVFNFTAIVETMQEKNAIKVIQSIKELSTLLIHLFQQPDERAEFGTAGGQLIELNRGATLCVLEQIATYLGTDHVT